MASEAVKLHTCNGCGKTEPWSDSWSRYGSINDIDDGVPIIKSCSDKCKAAQPSTGAAKSKRGRDGGARAAIKAARVEPDPEGAAVLGVLEQIEKRYEQGGDVGGLIRQMRADWSKPVKP